MYTQESPFYSFINKLLRDRDRQRLKPFFPWLKIVLSALRSLPRETRTVYRGVKRDLSSKFKKGKKFVWWSITSTTSSVDTIQQDTFLGERGERTLFAIEAKSAVLVTEYAALGDEEAEWLLPPGFLFCFVLFCICLFVCFSSPTILFFFFFPLLFSKITHRHLSRSTAILSLGSNLHMIQLKEIDGPPLIDLPSPPTPLPTPLLPPQQPTKIKLYHGTSSFYLPKIIEKGHLEPSKEFDLISWGVFDQFKDESRGLGEVCGCWKTIFFWKRELIRIRL